MAAQAFLTLVGGDEIEDRTIGGVPLRPGLGRQPVGHTERLPLLVDDDANIAVQGLLNRHFMAVAVPASIEIDIGDGIGLGGSFVPKLLVIDHFLREDQCQDQPMQGRDAEDHGTRQVPFVAFRITPGNEPHQEIRQERQGNRSAHEDCSDEKLE